MAVEFIVHEFSLGDVDDPELYAAAPIWEWQQTEKGKWVMEHSIEPPYWKWNKGSPQAWYYSCIIVATFEGADATFYKLKYQV
jgi:hypothetical protein